MPRRRLSEQQLKRVRAIQERRRQQQELRREDCLADCADDSPDQPPRAGRVVARHGANLAVEDDNGRIFHCVSRRHVGDLVCGDRVQWIPTGARTGVIAALEPRVSLLGRPDGAGRDKPLAANLTRMLIVVAPEPPPAGDLIDQYCIAAERMGVSALLLCNKSDLLHDGPEHQRLLERLSLYPRIGYPLLRVSARDPRALEPLRAMLSGELSMLVGQSGVGKSSIAKALLPDRDVRIGQLSQATGLGRHTTSTASCYPLPGGGHLIDSPGVRSFRLPPLGQTELEQGFREFRAHLGRCRFANCQHDTEPDCAIRAAVAAGDIAPERWETFRRLLRAS